MLFFDIETVADTSKEHLFKEMELHETERNRQFIPELHPEFCKIVALGYAIDDRPVQALSGVETYILRQFWELAKGQTLCGFNVLNFDLPVIYVRSAELGIRSSRLIDRKPWAGHVIDLYEARRYTAGSMGLKMLAKSYGFRMADADGSQVKDMDAGQIELYVKSDVEITRELYKRYKGFFVS
jgi:hypothetical protein